MAKITVFIEDDCVADFEDAIWNADFVAEWVVELNEEKK